MFMTVEIEKNSSGAPPEEKKKFPDIFLIVQKF
jgi:hypothetical protein